MADRLQPRDTKKPFKRQELCPHCHVRVLAECLSIAVGQDTGVLSRPPEDSEGIRNWYIDRLICPNCLQVSLDLVTELQTTRVIGLSGGGIPHYEEVGRERILPRGGARPPLPLDVPREFAVDYIEASAVLPVSPNASAALSRRCLQHLLRFALKNLHGGLKPKKNDLNHEIQAVLEGGNLPSHVAEELHDFRKLGNIAAHPKTSINTGEIVPVELGEADWTLDVLDSLFDFYFVAPAKAKLRRQARAAKFQDVGMSDDKGPDPASQAVAQKRP